MPRASVPTAEVVLRLRLGGLPSPSRISVVLSWLVDSPDLSGCGHRFLSSLSPNRPRASTKWNSLRVHVARQSKTNSAQESCRREGWFCSLAVEWICRLRVPVVKNLRQEF